MKLLLLTFVLICATSISHATSYNDVMAQAAEAKKFRERCPGGDAAKPPSSHYTRSHQEYDARTECIRSDFQVDVGVIPAVQMGEYMISDYSHHDYILTGGVGPCVAITFFDPVTKTGMLAHLPPSAVFYSKDPHVKNQRSQDPHDKKFFEDILTAFEKKGIPRDRIEASVYGNMPSRTGLKDVLKGIFEHAGLQNIKFDNVRELIKYEGQIEGTGSLKIFDLKTGQVQSFANPDISILDLSGWLQRIEKNDARNKNSVIEYLVPAPGSADQISRSKNKTVAPMRSRSGVR